MLPRHLSAALLCSLFGLVSARADDTNKTRSRPALEKKAYQDIDVTQFDQMRAEKQSIVLDVRTPQEFASGHIPGALNIDWKSPDFQDKASALDKSRTYLVHCASGIRSANACNKLSTMEFKHCYNLAGGFRAWEKAGKPIEKNN
jgi:phage shock protein E